MVNILLVTAVVMNVDQNDYHFWFQGIWICSMWTSIAHQNDNHCYMITKIITIFIKMMTLMITMIKMVIKIMTMIMISGKMNAHHVDIHQPGHFPCPGQKCGKVTFFYSFKFWQNLGNTVTIFYSLKFCNFLSLSSNSTRWRNYLNLTMVCDDLHDCKIYLNLIFDFFDFSVYFSFICLLTCVLSGVHQQEQTDIPLLKVRK